MHWPLITTGIKKNIYIFLYIRTFLLLFQVSLFILHCHLKYAVSAFSIKESTQKTNGINLATQAVEGKCLFDLKVYIVVCTLFSGKGTSYKNNGKSLFGKKM